MAKRKRKLTSAEKAEKRRRRREYMTIFINGKQKRVKRPPTIEGLTVDEFIRTNADPIWLCQSSRPRPPRSCEAEGLLKGLAQ